MNLDLDQMVELLDQYSDVYPSSPTGARGWVRGKRQLSKSDPEVYIEWDKTHWRYQNERDGWTFEHHFKPVDDLDMHQILSNAQEQVEAERCSECGGVHTPEGTPEEFLDVLMEASEAAVASDGYFIITLTPREYEGYLVYEPEIYSRVLSETAREMIKAQLVHYAGQLFTQTALDNVRDLQERREDR